MALKKTISKETFHIINEKLKEVEIYVKKIKFGAVPVAESGRKTGFVGFFKGLCVKAVRVIFNDYVNIENAPLRYICTYKLSQDLS